MISVVCVYNKEDVLADALLSSLHRQTAAYELIALDNTGGRFHSAAEAYNLGGARAKGEYIMFVHQDVWLATRTWLEDVERMLGRLPALGVAGVAGSFSVSDRARIGDTAVGHLHFLCEPNQVELYLCGTESAEVETLDECILLVPRTVFDVLRFDESTFDGWDCYGADYCLTARNLGLKTYVVPAPCSHSCARETYARWEFEGLLEYQKKLYAKHGRGNGTICTFLGDVNPQNLRNWAREAALDSLQRRLVPDRLTFLSQELEGCDSVLELNCGYRSLMGRLKFKVSLGLDSFRPYLQESRRRGFHTDHVLADLKSIPFRPQSFDAVVALDTVEGLTKEEGGTLIARMEELARKRVIVTTRKHSEPGFDYGYPVLQRQSHWGARDLIRRGYRVRGCAGERKAGGGKSVFRYRASRLWGWAEMLYRRVLYQCPFSAEQLMAVKRLDSRDRS